MSRVPLLRAEALALLLSLACLVCTLVACRAGEPEDRPPDIVLILIDTLRRDALSPYGAETQTPTIQRLADTGQVFTNAEGSFHQTTMSMGALFTGRTPSIESAEAGKTLAWNGRHWCGMARFSQGEDDSCIPRDLPTLAEQLRDAGYWTAGIVSNRLLFAPAGYEQGFDTWVEVSAGRTDRTTAQLALARAAGPVNAAVESALDDRPDQPAFVYVHYVDVHDWMVTDDEYANSVARLDGQLARLLEILDEGGIRENAVVFLTSDHGENLGEKHANYLARGHIGNPSFQPVLEIPLIVSPALFEGTERLLGTRDINRLVREAAGLEIDPAAEPDLLEPGEVFLSEKRFLTYRKGRFKTAFHRDRMGRWAIFDLEADPAETENVIALQREVGAAYLARVQEIARQLAVTRTEPESQELSEDDRERLRALGYLEDEEADRRAEEAERSAAENEK